MSVQEANIFQRLGALRVCMEHVIWLVPVVQMVCAGLKQVPDMARIQLHGCAKQFVSRLMMRNCACFDVNFSHRQKSSMLSPIISVILRTLKV